MGYERQNNWDSSMPLPAPMNTDEVRRFELEMYRREHRDLDIAIAALQESRNSELLTIRRLKKKKLALKDRIARLQDQINPDIIA